MKNLVLAVFIACLSMSCTEKIVQLPETENRNITEIVDVSPIYIFYDETKTDSTDFNRKNMIGTTNWLVNVDKRLTLKQILPHLQYLQEKRNKDGMHKNKNAKNYFTCSNPEIQNLAFIEFTDVVYESDLSNKLFHDFSNPSNFGHVKFNSLENIEIEIESESHGINESYNFIELFSEINELIKSGNLKLKLSFSSSLLFQDYIDVKTKMFTINSDSLQILNHEFIYN